MYLEQKQQEFLTRNYDVVHLKEKRTLDAAQAAADLLKKVDTLGFSDLSQANWHGELYFQAVTLLTSAAKDGTSYANVARLLEYSARLQLAHGPFAQTADEANKRLAYFTTVFEGRHDASVRAFREFLNVVDYLSLLETNAETGNQLRHIVEQLRTDLTHRRGESGIYIMRIEREPRLLATQAFIEYLIDYLLKHTDNPTELQQVLKKYIQRIVPNAPGTSVDAAHHHLEALMQAKGKEDSLDPSTIQELLTIRYIGIQGELLHLSPSRS